MTSRATTLGDYIAELMAKTEHTNRSLAAAAGISEGAVRNVLKFGVDTGAKDPDARTLRRIANALGVHPLRLYKLAGYLPPEPDTHSARADYVADIFDSLALDKQEAVLGVLDAMANKPNVTRAVQEMRSDLNNPLAGLDINAQGIIRSLANELIAKYQMSEPPDISRIEPNAELFQYSWTKLPKSTQQRVKALILHKLALEYDPTMVDPEWRS